MTIEMTTCFAAFILILGSIFLFLAGYAAFLQPSLSTTSADQLAQKINSDRYSFFPNKNIADHISRGMWFVFFNSPRNNQITVHHNKAAKNNLSANPNSEN
jgi:hypothetical protein